MSYIAQTGAFIAQASGNTDQNMVRRRSPRAEVDISVHVCHETGYIPNYSSVEWKQQTDIVDGRVSGLRIIRTRLPGCRAERS